MGGALQPARTLVRRWRNSRRRRFVILFAPRSGSSWLRSLLDANPAYHLGFELLAKTPEPSAQEAAVNRFFANHDLWKGIKATGFKLGGYQVKDRNGVKRALTDNRVSIVHVRRKNLLKTAISQIRRAELAERTRAELGRKLQNRVEGVAPPPPTVVEPDLLMRRLKTAEKTDALTAELGAFFDRPRLEVTYESLMADLDPQIDRIADFIGAPVPVRDGYKPRKNTPDDLTEAVANYDEVAKALTGTPYERYLQA